LARLDLRSLAAVRAAGERRSMASSCPFTMVAF
jgi:hypothetical protein